jgi:hypothetical protein
MILALLNLSPSLTAMFHLANAPDAKISSLPDVSPKFISLSTAYPNRSILYVENKKHTNHPHLHWHLRRDATDTSVLSSVKLR